MGDIIQLLPEHVANQIAAGEVVQRPASVVKELVENAVDAKATIIQVIIKDAGRTLIQVVDNGTGMSVTDLRMAFERHATSKIRSTEDIFQILTNGFRGEALASIAAVSQVEAISKLDSEELGTKLIIEGSEVREQQPQVTKNGTSLSIKNLFFNVPARRNFLKSNNVEFRHIQDEIIRIALANPNIAFQLNHNNGIIYNLKKGNTKQRIIQLFGKKYESSLVPISEDTDLVKISGFLVKPELAKKSRGEQFVFVNNRFIRSAYLHKAILDAYEGLIPKTHNPGYFLYLEINPKRIDINIHPTKTEIKFEDDHAIFALLRSASKHALGQYNVAPSLDFEQLNEWEIPTVSKTEVPKMPQIKIDPNFNPFNNQRIAPKKEEIKATEQIFKDFAIEHEKLEQEQLFNETNLELKGNCIQWMNQYIIYQQNQTLYIIDQHRAHQKVIFEQLSSNNTNVLSQQLLFPIELEFNEQEIKKIQQLESQLITFGFDLKIETHQLIIQSIPSEMKQDAIPDLFADFLSDLEFKEEIELKNQILKYVAKAAAIKKGELLQPEQMKYLAQQLFNYEQPNISPFNKRIFVGLKQEEINKKLN